MGLALNAIARQAPLHGTLRLGDGQRLSVTVTGISADRCQVAVSEMLPVDAVVRLDVPGREPVHASVHWSIVGKSGLLFVGARPAPRS